MAHKPAGERHLRKQRRIPPLAARARREEPDLRLAFALEERCLPALLIFGWVAALVSAPRGAVAWAWLAALALCLAMRFVTASTWVRARRAVAPGSPAGVRYSLSYGIEFALWLAQFVAIAPADRIDSAALAVSAAGALLVAAVTLSRWPRAWDLYVAGWGLIVAVAIVRSGFVVGPFSLGLPLWLAAVWWVGRGHVTAPLTELAATLQQTASDRSTRAGWSAAIRASPAPLLVVRNARVAEANSAAAQFFERDARQLVGMRIGELLTFDPPEALDPLRDDVQERAARVRVARPGRDPVTRGAQVRVLQPGRASSVIMVALSAAGEAPGTVGPAPDIAEDARRLAVWLGGASGQPWYRDEAGHLFLPPELAALGAKDSAPVDFPLIHGVRADERERVTTAFRQALRGEVFDEQMTVVDVNGIASTVRVVCATRVIAETGAAPVVGIVAPARATAEARTPEPRAMQPAGRDAMSSLPVLMWLVDADGRVSLLNDADPWRWGLAQPAFTRPKWSVAFDFRERGRDDVGQALQNARDGKPTFDLVNARATRAGGRIVLRSHFVPYGAGETRSVLVLDTIADPRQLAEVDRLRRSKAQYKALVEASTSLIWACDEHFVFTFASRRAAREIYGYEPQEIIGRPVAALLSNQVEQKVVRQHLARLRIGRPVRDLETIQQARDGQRLVIAIDAVPLKTVDGRFAGAIGMSTDLTMVKQRERRLAEALRIERTVLDSAGQAIAVVKDGLVARCNDAFLQLLHVQPAQLARTPIAAYLAAGEEWSQIVAAADAGRADDRAVVREVLVRRGGTDATAWCQLTVRSIAGAEYVLVLADIDLIRRREADALHDAQHDELTGLPNRRLLGTRASTALAAAALRNAHCAVFAIDLDGFKEINDRLGHNVGDEVLREIAQRLVRALRPEDSVARVGGDEFAMLLPDAGSRTDIERIAVRVLHSVAQPVVLATGEPASISASLGIAIAPEQGRDLEGLLQLADLAMYEAKLKGKNRYAFAAVTPDDATVGGPRKA